MYKGKTKLLVVIFALFAMLSVAIISPALSDDSSADMSGTSLVVIYDDTQTTQLRAGSSTQFTFNVYSNYADDRILYVYANSGDQTLMSIRTVHQLN